MNVTNQTRRYLRRLHDGKDYVVQNRILIIIILINFILANLAIGLIILLTMGKLPLDGLRLTGPIKSTAKHQHGTYDNDFIVGTYWQDGALLVDGTAIRAKDIRAVNSSITATYMINEGVMYQHGGLMFAESVSFPPLKDKDGNIIKDKDGNPAKDWLAIPEFYISGRMSITPDYKNERIYFMSSYAYVDKDGFTGISNKEINRIKKEIIKELKKEKTE